MIVENIQSDQNDIDSPEDTTKTSSEELDDTNEDVTEVETINTYKFKNQKFC